jgi:hypothetical protein
MRLPGLVDQKLLKWSKVAGSLVSYSGMFIDGCYTRERDQRPEIRLRIVPRGRRSSAACAPPGASHAASLMNEHINGS